MSEQDRKIVLIQGRVTDDASLRKTVDILAEGLQSITSERVVTASHGDLADARPSRRFIVGTAADEGLELLGATPALDSAAAESFRISSRAVDGVPTTFVVGSDSGAARHGVYRLLEEVGYSFHLYGDLLPPRCDDLPSLEGDTTYSARFGLRGAQLWCTWYPGRDSWSWEDYRQYLDQFPKLGLNLFDFPLYFYEPLYTGFSLERGSESRQIQSGTDTGLVRIGGEHFARFEPRFVSPDIPDRADQSARTAAATALMRRAFAHARENGVHTAVGIEIMNFAFFDNGSLDAIPASDRYADGRLVSPSSASARALTRARLAALIAAFPDCDYYVMWQSEIGVFRDDPGSPHPDDVTFRSAFAEYADRLAPADLDYLHWVRLAAELMRELKPHARLVTAGWGAESLMWAADAILPAEVVRNSIGYYEPRFTIDEHRIEPYTATSGETWHTTWAETDLHMWSLQPKLDATEQVLDQLAAAGARGASVLHWRTLFCDLDITFFARSCWSPHPTASDHRRQWAAAKFGDECASEVERALVELELFNELTLRGDKFTLVGFDCFILGLLTADKMMAMDHPMPEDFLRSQVDPMMQACPELIAVLGRAEDAALAALSRADDSRRDRLRFLANRVSYTRMLHECVLATAHAVTAFSSATTAARESDASRFLLSALSHIRSAAPEQLVRLFAAVMSEENDVVDRGEAGLLLSLNQKLLGSLLRIEKRILIGLGLAPIEHRSGPAPRLRVRAGMGLPYFTGSDDAVAHGRRDGSRWRRADDHVVGADGYHYELVGGAASSRVAQDLGWWHGRDEVRLHIRLPKSFDGGTLRIHLRDNPSWPALTRRQTVSVDGVDLGEFDDMFGRGLYCDEGICVEHAIPAGASTLELRARRTGSSDVIVSGFDIV